MKKVVFVIIIILIHILIFTIRMTNRQQINDGIGTSKQEINVFNRKFEDFYGINNSEDIKILLQQCMDDYLIYAEEPVKNPLIKFLKNNDEIILEHENSHVYVEKKERKYYLGLQNVLDNIEDNKSYKVEFKYSPHIIVDGASLIREIDITECDEPPEKFDKKNLEKNRVYVEEKQNVSIIK